MLSTVWEYLNSNANAVGITVIATIVVALANVVLAVLTVCYVVVTWRQTKHVREQAGEMAKQSAVMELQAEELRRQDGQRIRRAIQAVIAETMANDQCAKSGVPSPFLCEAYPTYLWAFYEVDMSDKTREAIAKAHLSAKRFNLEYVGETTGRVETGKSTKAWDLATENISASLEAINSDQALQQLLARNGKRECPPAQQS